MLNLSLTMTRNGDDTTLATFVKRVRDEKGLSVNDVARKSGGTISNAYVSKIENGLATNPSRRKIKALAKGLDLPAEQVRQVADGVREDQIDFADSALSLLQQKLRTAAPEDRRVLEEAIQMLTDWAARKEESRLRG